MPSLINAAGKGNHDYYYTERDANIRALKYFVKNVPGFESVDSNGNASSLWNFVKNPILWYDTNKSSTDEANARALKERIHWPSFSYNTNIDKGEDNSEYVDEVVVIKLFKF